MSSPRGEDSRVRQLHSYRLAVESGWMCGVSRGLRVLLWSLDKIKRQCLWITCDIASSGR